MSDSDASPYDALLVVSFGGPEKPEDVIPFLENVLRGKPVPRERLLEVAEHYHHFNGVSPINAQVREFIGALQVELSRSGIELPVYWGNRNWHPLLPDTLRQMQQDGIRKALAFVTSAYSSYSGCRQYRENIETARQEVGADAPIIEKIRVFYNHPGFVSANADRLREALSRISPEQQHQARIAFTAHSIPLSMSSNCNYVSQLEECCRLIADELSLPRERWSLVYQSRSGRPTDPWLEPDIGDHLRQLKDAKASAVVIAPVGFLSDHMEILFDLDEEARAICNELGLEMSRSATVGVHPKFISTVRELIEERLGRRGERNAIGRFGPSHDVCPVDCCRYTVPQRPATAGPPQKPGANPSSP